MKTISKKIQPNKPALKSGVTQPKKAALKYDIQMTSIFQMKKARKKLISNIDHFISNFNNSSHCIVLLHEKYSNDIKDTEAGGAEDNDALFIFNLSQKKYQKIEIQIKGEYNLYNAKLLLILNSVYIVDGSDFNDGRLTPSLYVISLRDKCVKQLSESTVTKVNMGVCHYQGSFIYSLCGHFDTSVLDSCEKYSIKTDTWSNMPHANVARDSAGCAIIKSSVYIFGGKSEYGLVGTIERISAVASSKWVKFQLQSNPSIKQLYDIFPLYIDNNNVIIAGKDNREQSYAYMANIKKQTFVSTMGIPKDIIVSSMQGMSFSALSSKSTITKISNKGTILERFNISSIMKEWRHNAITVVVDK